MEYNPEKVLIDLWENLGVELRAKGRRENKPREMVEDIRQETILRYLKQLEKEHVREPYHWCRRTALRLWVREQSKRRSHYSYDDEMDAPTERDPAAIVERREFIQCIDPNWRSHIEQGLDYTRGYKLDQRTRDTIRRQAMRLLGGENNEC